MSAILPPPAELSIFVTAALVLGLTPGPDMLLVLNRSLTFGFQAGMVTMAGIVSGAFVHTLAAAIGLSLLLVELPLAYDILRYGGAAYLAYMAWQIVRQRRGLELSTPGEATPLGAGRLFWQALLTNLLNPKVALFILAFLPQFVPAGADNPAIRILALGVIFFGLGIVIMTVMAALAGRIRHWVRRRPGLLAGQSILTGLLLLVFAGGLLVAQRPVR